MRMANSEHTFYKPTASVQKRGLHTSAVQTRKAAAGALSRLSHPACSFLLRALVATHDVSPCRRPYEDSVTWGHLPPRNEALTGSLVETSPLPHTCTLLFCLTHYPQFIQATQPPDWMDCLVQPPLQLDMAVSSGGMQTQAPAAQALRLQDVRKPHTSETVSGVPWHTSSLHTQLPLPNTMSYSKIRP